MKLLFFRLRKYFSYRLRRVDAHGLHSPFLYNLYKQVLIPSRKFRLDSVEELRKSLKKNHQLIDLYDLKEGRNYKRTIASIAKTSLSTPQFSSFLNLLIDFLKIENAIETGTSLGINAMYMAGSDHIKTLTTIEASPIVASIAKSQFKKLLQHKIVLKEGTVQEIFESAVIQKQPGLCFIDADHRAEAVLFCVETLMSQCPSIACIVVHDIYWSPNMSQAWNALKGDSRFKLTVDIFQAGILFPNIQTPKQHFTIRF